MANLKLTRKKRGKAITEIFKKEIDNEEEKRCYVCKKKIEGRAVYLCETASRHEKCSPMTKNFQKAFPDAWTNKYIQEEPEPEPIKYRRLLRLKEN